MCLQSTSTDLLLRKHSVPWSDRHKLRRCPSYSTSFVFLLQHTKALACDWCSRRHYCKDVPISPHTDSIWILGRTIFLKMGILLCLCVCVCVSVCVCRGGGEGICKGDQIRCPSFLSFHCSFGTSFHLPYSSLLSSTLGQVGRHQRRRWRYQARSSCGVCAIRYAHRVL